MSAPRRAAGMPVTAVSLYADDPDGLVDAYAT